MSSHSEFAYAQARIQARHGRRAEAADWRRLASSGDLENFLQAAQRTPLASWTQGLQADRSSHAIEIQLRQRFRDYVGEVAGWLPTGARPVVHWISQLPDLPALQHLLSTGTAPAWMFNDPQLQPLAEADRGHRGVVIRTTEFAPLADAWQKGIALPDAWLEQWHRRWPKIKAQQQGLEYLGRLLQRFLSGSTARETGRAGGDPHARLISGLRYVFRRFSFKPAAACAHLGLVALDLQQLRGELVQRALFDERTALRI